MSLGSFFRLPRLFLFMRISQKKRVVDHINCKLHNINKECRKFKRQNHYFAQRYQMSRPLFDKVISHSSEGATQIAGMIMIDTHLN